MEVTKKVPTLRFPGFEEEWEEDELGNLVEVSKKKFNPNTKETILPCIELEHLEQGSGRLLSHSFSDEQRSIKNYFYEGEILFGKLRPYLKKYWKATFEGVCSSEIIVLNGTKISNDYLFNIVQLQKFNEIANVSSGSKMPRADWNYMKEHPFHFPSLPEQQKIAACLTAMDDTIEDQQQKVEQLQSYKKGLLQQLFSQTLRFPGFEGEWEEKKLGEVTDIRTGNNDLQDKVDDGEYPFFVRSANIEHIDSYTYDGEAILIPGDGNIGQIYHYINGRFAYHQRVYKISDFVDVTGKYIYYYMNEFFKKEALRNSVKATVDSLRLPTLTNFKVQTPSLPEQQKIADCLSTLDEVIELEQQKLEKLQVYKKGLLQQLFA